MAKKKVSKASPRRRRSAPAPAPSPAAASAAASAPRGVREDVPRARVGVAVQAILTQHNPARVVVEAQGGGKYRISWGPAIAPDDGPTPPPPVH